MKRHKLKLVLLLLVLLLETNCTKKGGMGGGGMGGGEQGGGGGPQGGEGGCGPGGCGGGPGGDGNPIARPDGLNDLLPGNIPQGLGDPTATGLPKPGEIPQGPVGNRVDPNDLQVTPSGSLNGEGSGATPPSLDAGNTAPAANTSVADAREEHLDAFASAIAQRDAAIAQAKLDRDSAADASDLAFKNSNDKIFVEKARQAIKIADDSDAKVKALSDIVEKNKARIDDSTATVASIHN